MIDAPLAREDETTWTRLRRRKVVQWGIAYAAGAWGFQQGLAYLSALLNWPAQLQRLTGLALLIGLPIALVLAWYHGDRGEQRVGRAELTILTFLLLLGGGTFWYYQRTSEAARKEAATTADTPTQHDESLEAADARPSIAVLPFENRSRAADDTFFVDGIHDDILTQLSKVSAIRVISRSSVEQFRNTGLTMKAIADQLGVTLILEGGVQRAGDRVRINVQLINADTDAHLWADSYDRKLNTANIFAIQSEVAAAIAVALKASLTAGELARVNSIPTQSLEAWQAYQLGKQRMASRTSGALTEAEEHFRRAVELDASFALAWTGLADTVRLQTEYSGRPKAAGLAESEKAVMRALELDPNLAEAWASAGGIEYNRLQLGRSEEMLRRAIGLNHNYAPAYQWLSAVLSDLGRRNEALAVAERAVVLDPLSAIINDVLGLKRSEVGRFNDALVAHEQAIAIDPTLANAYLNIGTVHADGLGRYDTAIAWYEKAASVDPGDPLIPAVAALAYWDLTDDSQAGRWLDRARAIGSANEYLLVAAFLDLDRGDEASARRHAQAAADRDPRMMFLIRDLDLRKGDYASARARYAQALPELFAKELPRFNDRDVSAAIDLALVLQHTGEGDRARALLDRGEAFLRSIPRMGPAGYGFSDVAIHALRGQKAKALAALREAERAGWRRWWRYHRDFNPNLASIRNESEFKATFANIERDMAQQRARLAARPKDAPLELTPASR